MKLRLSVQTGARAHPTINHKWLFNVPLNTLNIQLFDKNNLKLIDVTGLDDNTSINFTTFAKQGYSVNCNISVSNYNNTIKAGTILIDIPLREVTDSIELRLTLTSPDLVTYNQTFELYGYDIGNDINWANFGGTVGDTEPQYWKCFPNTIADPIENNSNWIYRPDAYGLWYDNNDNNNVTCLYDYPNITGTPSEPIIKEYGNDQFIVRNPPFIIELHKDLDTDINDYDYPSIYIYDLYSKLAIYKAHAINPNTPTLEECESVRYIIDKLTGTITDITNDDVYILNVDFTSLDITQTYNIVSRRFRDGNEYTHPNIYIFRPQQFIPKIEATVNDVDLTTINSVSDYLKFRDNLILDKVRNNVYDKVYVNGILRLAYGGLHTYTKITRFGDVLLETNIRQMLRSVDNVCYGEDDDVFDSSQFDIDFPITDTGNLNVKHSVFLLGVFVNNEDVHNTYNTVHNNDKVTILYPHSNIQSSLPPITWNDFTTIGSPSNLVEQSFIVQNIHDYGIDGKLQDLHDDGVFAYMYTPLSIFLGYRNYYIHSTVSDGVLPVSSNLVGYARQDVGVKDVKENIIFGINGIDIHITPNDNNGSTNQSCNDIYLSIDTEHEISYEISLSRFNEETLTFEMLSNYPRVITENTTISNLDDGVYHLTFNDNEPYTIIISCAAATCMTKAVKAIICGCCEHDDCKSKVNNTFNELNVLYDTYYQIISLYSDEFTYSPSYMLDLPDNVIVELAKLLPRIEDICNDCKLFVKPCNHC